MTGAAGFVGRWLVEALDAAGAGTFGLDERGSAVGVDIRNREQLAACVQRVRPTAIVHLAAISANGEANKDPFGAWQTNLQGTINLAEACMHHAPGCRFVFASSSEVYGLAFNDNTTAILESAALQPVTTYGATKAAAEVALGQLCRMGLDAVIFRPFNHTGPRQSPTFVASSFAKQIALIEGGHLPPILHVGNLNVMRDFLDVRDVVRAYRDAALREYPLPSGMIVNLATGAPVAISKLLEQFLSYCKVRVEVSEEPSLRRPSEVPIASGDPTIASKIMSWRPHIELDQTIQDLLQFWRGEVAAGRAT